MKKENEKWKLFFKATGTNKSYIIREILQNHGIPVKLDARSVALGWSAHKNCVFLREQDFDRAICILEERENDFVERNIDNFYSKDKSYNIKKFIFSVFGLVAFVFFATLVGFLCIWIGTGLIGLFAPIMLVGGLILVFWAFGNRIKGILRIHKTMRKLGRKPNYTVEELADAIGVTEERLKEIEIFTTYRPGGWMSAGSFQTGISRDKVSRKDAKYLVKALYTFYFD